MSEWLWLPAIGFIFATQFVQLLWHIGLSKWLSRLQREVEALRLAHDGMVRLLSVPSRPSRDTDHLLE